MKNRLSNQVSEMASAGLSLGVLGLTASLMLMGCSDRHRDPGNVVTPTATNVQSDSAIAESTDQLPAGMPATSIEDGSTSGATTGADADTAAANTDAATTTTHKTTLHKMHKRHMNHASTHSAAKHKASKSTETPAASEAAPATATGGGSDSGSTSSANSDMSGSTSAHMENAFLSAPGRNASALTDQGVSIRIDDAAAASTL